MRRNIGCGFLFHIKEIFFILLSLYTAAGLAGGELRRISVLRQWSVSDNLHRILAWSNSGAFWQPMDGRPCHVRLYPGGPRFVTVSLEALNEVLTTATIRRSRLLGLDGISTVTFPATYDVKWYEIEKLYYDELYISQNDETLMKNSDIE